MTRPLVTSLAFYLPQFHPIPENDRWWGPGFTEWTNVRAARPHFSGHDQPLIPGALGYYDLRDDEVRELQARLATDHRIDAFVYYHYWFHGRRLLDVPLERHLGATMTQMPFCICWVNENWTRRWDGGNDELLVEQTYSPEDDARHLRALLRLWDDARYVRLDGRPVVLIWNADAHPDIRRVTDLWRSGAQRAGHPDLSLIRVESHAQRGDPTLLGFDAACEFQPSADVFMRTPAQRPPRTTRQRLQYDPYLPERLRTPRRRRTHQRDRVRRYEDVHATWTHLDPPGYERYPCVCPSWDNSPRRPHGARIVHGSTPELYERWVRDAASRALALPRHLVFVNAWNEWAESCTLEPTARWGDRYLVAHRRGVESAEARRRVG